MAQIGFWDRYPEVREFAAGLVVKLATYAEIMATCAERFGEAYVPSRRHITRLRMGLVNGRWPRPAPDPKPEPAPEAAKTTETEALDHVPDVGKMVESPTPVPKPVSTAPAPASADQFVGSPSPNAPIKILGHWLLNPIVMSIALQCLSKSDEKRVFSRIMDEEAGRCGAGVRQPRNGRPSSRRCAEHSGRIGSITGGGRDTLRGADLRFPGPRMLAVRTLRSRK